MPKNSNQPKFWQLRKTVAKVAKAHGFKLSHRELHRITNEYQDYVNQDVELKGHDPKTYSDPTGEQAVRNWFATWVTQDIREVAA